MMMAPLGWVYSSDPAWLHQREDYLTATDFKELKPSIARASKEALAGARILPKFAAVWMSKHAHYSTQYECNSYGAEARGHILEPYAVELYNSTYGTDFAHWDDCLIVRDKVGYSPDAIRGIQCPGEVVIHTDEVGPKELLEIKSYSIDRHGQQLGIRPTATDERFQVAWSMYVSPSIEVGHIAFYHPDAPIPLIVKDYTRDDLKEELSLARQVDELYQRNCSLIEQEYLMHAVKSGKTEQEIFEEVMGIVP